MVDMTTRPDLTQLSLVTHFNQCLQNPTKWSVFEPLCTKVGNTITWGSKELQSYYLRTNDLSVMKRCSTMDGFAEFTSELLASFLRNCSGFKLRISLNSIQSTDPNTVQPIRTLLQLVDSEDVVLHLNELYTNDLDYENLIYLARHFGLMQFYTEEEKQSRFNLHKGGVYVLHTKDNSVSDRSPWGSILSTTLVRFDGEIGKFLQFTPITVSHTLEEDLMDFLSMPQKSKAVFQDMLFPKNTEGKPLLLKYADFGMNYCFYTEPYLLTELGLGCNFSNVLVLKDGELEEMRLREEDVVYYCLRQRQVNFDYDFYKKTYKLPDPLWEQLGCPVSLPRELIVDCLRSSHV